MRYVALLIALLVPVTAEGQVVGLKQVAGPKITTTETEGGTYIRAVRPESVSDTIRVWVEHITPTSAPDYQSARKADLVVWCYPSKWPAPNHVLPNVSGKIAVVRQNDVYWVISEQSIWWDRLVR
jgi:hypothetical protein